MVDLKLVRGAVVCPHLTCCIHQLFLGSIMPSQVGFASHVSKFRVFVFRVRVFLGCFLSLGFWFLGLGFASDVS